MNLNLLVIRTEHTEKLKAQYEVLGLEFSYHRHGKGSFHYSTEIGELVFEIYPLLKSQQKADHSLRLGFEVENVEAVLMKAKKEDWEVQQEKVETDWGTIAIIKDQDGRKVELKEVK